MDLAFESTRGSGSGNPWIRVLLNGVLIKTYPANNDWLEECLADTGFFSMPEIIETALEGLSRRMEKEHDLDWAANRELVVQFANQFPSFFEGFRLGLLRASKSPEQKAPKGASTAIQAYNQPRRIS